MKKKFGNEKDRSDLKERYIYAVVRYLPIKMQEDVEKELDSMISDLIEERCGDSEPTEKVLSEILTELGTPAELAMKYSGDEGKSLIGGIYFILWKRILKLVVPIIAAVVAFGTGVSVLVEQMNGNGANPEGVQMANLIFGRVIGGTIQGAIWGAVWVTIIFAVFSHYKANLTDKDFLKNLPAVSEKGARIKPWEPVISIVWIVVLGVVFLGFPQIIGIGVWSEATGWIPIFNIEVLHGSWYLIVVWLGLEAAKQVFLLKEGKYSQTVLFVTIFANVMIVAVLGSLFGNSAILNTEFVSHIGDFLQGEGGAVLIPWFERFNWLIFVIIIFALVVDTISTAVKTYKNSRKYAELF